MLYEDEDQYEDPDIYSRLLDCLGGISSVLKTQETSKEDVFLLSNSLANLWEVMKEETTEYANGNKLSFEAMINSIQMEMGQESKMDDDDSCDEETVTRKEVREVIRSNEVVISGVANKSPKEEFPGAEMLQLPDGGNDDVVSDVPDKGKSPEFEILKSHMTSGDSDVLKSPNTEMLQFPDEERSSPADDEMLKFPFDKMMKTPDVEMLRIEEMATNKTKLIENGCYHENNEENDEHVKEKIEQKICYKDNNGNDEQVMEKEKLHVGEMDTDKAKLSKNMCYHKDNEKNDEQVKERTELRTEERDNDMVNLNILAYYKDKDRNEKQGKKTDEFLDALERTEKLYLNLKDEDLNHQNITGNTSPGGRSWSQPNQSRYSYAHTSAAAGQGLVQPGSPSSPKIQQDNMGRLKRQNNQGVQSTSGNVQSTMQNKSRYF